MGFAAVGTMGYAVNTGLQTFSFTTVTPGDVVLMTVCVGSTSITSSSITGGNCGTWTKIVADVADTTFVGHVSLWMGVVNNTGNAPVTVNYSGSVSALPCYYHLQQFTNGTGGGTTWAVDGTQATGHDHATSTTIAFESLTASAGTRMYYGFDWSGQTSAVVGSTSGFTYELSTDGLARMACWDLSVGGTTKAPTATQTTTGTYVTLGAILIATPPTVPTATLRPTEMHPGRGTGTIGRFQKTPQSTFSGIVEDSSTPPILTGTGAVPTTLNIVVNPPAKSLLVVLGSFETGIPTGATVTDNSGVGIPWTYTAAIGGDGANGGLGFIGFKYFATAPGPFTVTLTSGGTGAGYMLTVRVLMGADPYQQTPSYQFTNSSAVLGAGGISVTPADLGSVYYGISINTDSVSAVQAYFNSVDTNIFNVHQNATNNATTAVWTTTPTDGVQGGAVIMGAYFDATAYGVVVAMEIKPASAMVTTGLPNNGVTAHYQWSYDVNLAYAGIEPARTIAAMVGAEADYATLVAWFGFDAALNVPIWVNNLNGGASHLAYPSGVQINGDTFYGPLPYESSPDYIRYLLMAEVCEEFMQAQLGGGGWFYLNTNEGSNGEGLSRFLAAQILLINGLTCNGNLAAVLTTGESLLSWLNSTRPDRINVANGTNLETDPTTGGAALFIWWMYAQLGYTIAQICQAPVTSTDTLRTFYQKITGLTTNPFPALNAMMGRAFPNQTGNTAASVNVNNPDNPFPLPASLITPANSVISALNAAGTTQTLTLSPAAIGNCYVLMLLRVTSTVTVSSVVGGGCATWQHIAGPYVDTNSAYSYDIYLGTVTSLGSTTLTVTNSGSLAANFASAAAKEFSSFYGANSVWSLDGSQSAGFTDASANPLLWPSLTPAAAGEMYVGYGQTSQGFTGTGTSGYVIEPDLDNFPFLYSPDISSAAQVPQVSFAIPATASGIAALIKVSGAPQGLYENTHSQAVARGNY